MTSGQLPIPPDTPYRALLDVKILVVAVMIAVAIVNRYALDAPAQSQRQRA